ncbi:MAG TPA: hypothetical protein VHJ82_10895 [Actinomycetota bacterium]|nr:hypothetical protein [Actinomycetota bacterium]
MIKKTVTIVVAGVCIAFLAGVGRAAHLTSGPETTHASDGGGQRRGAPSKGRTVEVMYSTGASIGIQDQVTACVPGAPISSCILVPALGNENFVSIEIVDASGLPVPAFVGPHDDDPSGEPICGTTSQPVPIIGGIEAEVVLNAFDPAAPCAGVATTGVVKLTFFRRR